MEIMKLILRKIKNYLVLGFMLILVNFGCLEESKENRSSDETILKDENFNLNKILTENSNIHDEDFIQFSSLEKLPEINENSFKVDQNWMLKFLFSLEGPYEHPFSNITDHEVRILFPSKITESCVDRTDPNSFNESITDFKYFLINDQLVAAERTYLYSSGEKESDKIIYIYDENGQWKGLFYVDDYYDSYKNGDGWFIEYGDGVIRIFEQMYGEIDLIETFYLDLKGNILGSKTERLVNRGTSFELFSERFFYYENDDLKEIKTKYSDREEVVSINKRNEKLDVIKYNGVVNIEISQIYTENLLRQEIEKNPKGVIGSNIDYLYKYNYDAKNRIISKEGYNLESNFLLFKYLYEYDENALTSELE